MSKRRDKERVKKKRRMDIGGGFDVHESNLVAAVVDADDNVIEAEFRNEIDAYAEIVGWLNENKCVHVGLESTGNYWKAPVAYLVHKGFAMHVANPEYVKGIPGHKTDKIDAKRLARYTRDGYMPDSIVLDGALDDLKNITRLRSRTVAERTRMKNRVSALIARTGVRLKCTDKFGKAGMAIMRDMAAGKPVTEVFTPARCKSMGMKTSDEIMAALDKLLSPSTRAELKVLLDAIKEADERIKELENTIRLVATSSDKIKPEVELVKSVPGFADIAGPIVVAETCGFDRFPTKENYSGYVGIVPEVDNSGEREVDGIMVNKTHFGRIRTRCNKHLKWIFMLAAGTVIRLPENPLVAPLKRFHERMKKRHRGQYGPQQSLAALAHKLVKIVYAVVTSGKPYVAVDGSSKACWTRRREKVAAGPNEGQVMKKVCALLCSDPVPAHLTRPEGSAAS